MRKVLQLVAAFAAALVAAAAASGAPEARFTLAGTVTHVVDGDTLDVALPGGKRERVRLVGVDAAERGSCYAAPATAQVRTLTLSKRVVLKGDAVQPRRDRYGRLLAYVWLPGGRDLGYQLLAGGYVELYDASFDRLALYRRAEATAKGTRVGRWKSCGAVTPIAPVAAPAPPAGCHPSYSPCLPVTSDLDCADVRALGAAPVRVFGTDPYRLDADGDGLGCE